MSTPVVTFNINDHEVKSYSSITACAKALGRDPSTISRAASGDRGIVSTCDDTIISYLYFEDE
jgi:hypothetical protein